MSTINLMTPFLDGGLKSIKFFNGRLLSGEDLTTEKAANRQEHEWLGQAIGDGVVSGLEVTLSSASSPTVTVQPGLAISRTGDLVNLASSVDVALVQPSNASTAGASSPGASTSPFGTCQPLVPGVYLSGAGIYLLTIARACGTQGRAPVNGLLDGGDTCNAKYVVAGVQFRLIALTQFSSTELLDARLRSIAAAKCFGFDVDPLVDPFGASAPPPRGIVDALRGSVLADTEVPLAILSWTINGIGFIDMWSARRRVARADAADDSVFPIGDRDIARGEAVLLQFQDNLSSLATGFPETAIATSAFAYLPPAGLLPIVDPLRGMRGFIQEMFFKGLTVRGPLDIEGARAQAILRTSFQYPSVDLSTGEMFWLFRTRQNAQSTTARPFLIFVSGQMPFFGASRDDVARYDFGSWI